jgi:hypothetical protein
MAVMIVALLSMSALYYLVMRWLNNERDAAVIGVRGGVPLSLTHRWQVFEPPREFRRLNYMSAASMTGLL